MRSRELLLIGTLVIVACVPALTDAQTFGFGRTPTEAELKAVFPSAAPDGSGLPAGSGSAKEGVAVYKQKCAACHGPEGKGTPLHRGLIPLGNAKPVKLEGSLVPYATTVWDFINRGMPLGKEGTLTANEVYALTAYLLNINGVIPEDEILDAQSLPKVKMPIGDKYALLPDWKPRTPRLKGYPY